ncbi:hypothetical protein [Metabacillus iocasae]|uniref:Uncharacterized protein n=1 Tax=Priestia iocasae TaxID=2291674 RepID=A0ABS2QV50_9BACI|nr:hypothetical protein [Metabacillus iocasae]MBM7702807.1 hypothetical protein [Metabacillus iocasae]
MKQTIRFLLTIAVIVIVWVFFFGIRLIGYVDSVQQKGLRATECGTVGCSDIAFTFSTLWTASFFVFIPLLLPIIVSVYAFKKKA